jgi:hypothetical protein
VIAIALLAGAFVLATGILIGRLLPERRKGPKAVEALCGCTHHHSFHDPESGACNATVQVNQYGGSYLYEPCACRRYSGPEPLPEYYAPEIAGESGQ